jgi:[ribosomal protein S18]-alanine N-acetyltransferase
MQAPGERVGDSSATTVRRMRLSDVPLALSILQQSPEASLWSGESLLESASQGIAWVAESSGRVAGILVGRSAADEFEIWNLAVAKEFRRRGVASRLVTTAAENARAAGAQQTYAEVRASNDGAIAFYTRLGFRICGRRPNYYRDPPEDAMLLVLYRNEIDP